MSVNYYFFLFVEHSFKFSTEFAIFIKKSLSKIVKSKMYRLSLYLSLWWNSNHFFLFLSIFTYVRMKLSWNFRPVIPVAYYITCLFFFEIDFCFDIDTFKNPFGLYVFRLLICKFTNFRYYIIEFSESSSVYWKCFLLETFFKWCLSFKDL